ncbi:hypothetical protein M378DRAFT_18367 [Amanita muscaria Koide BX008]|uniref:HAT C-terminal dimerisation domain-containing protein n=1 Tax=Amanita muscaria (strain Koide BX008) TaxID=946122 RepID=A0A0C2W1I4_AMAMK|nr:hypothetical protein M378DRAFT_18367 [Amanita muscaria Koide BX008]
MPHRDKVREGIVDEWGRWFEKLKLDMSQAAGRVSFTADIWSSTNLSSYLALTVHWISQSAGSKLILRMALIGFHLLKQRHTGKNIAKAILYLVDRAGLTSEGRNQIGYFTLDNAENNATAMQELQQLLNNHENGRIEFDHLNNRVRCYPHIINICSTHILASVTKVTASSLSEVKVQDNNRHDLLIFTKDPDDVDDTDSEDTGSDLEFSDDEDLDDIPLARRFPGGTLSLQAWFQGMKRDPVKRARKLVRLLRSSNQRKRGLQSLIEVGNERGWFSDSEGNVIQVPALQPLQDVKTRWDSVYFMLQRLRALRPAIDKFINDELHKFKDYKLSESDWEIIEGLEAVLDIPHAVQKVMSEEANPVLFSAIYSFEKFMTNLEKMGRKYEKLRPWTETGLFWAKKYYRRMDDTDATSSAPATATLTKTPAAPAKSMKAAIPSRFKLELDYPLPRLGGTSSTVEDEYRKYTMGGLSSENMDMLTFWEANKTEFPTLFAIAMDYLPIQASSVPCERVFSSAKETDTVKRNRLSSLLMEMLQMLKFSLKKERSAKRLNFTGMAGSYSEVAMKLTTSQAKADLLTSLFTGDRDAAVDAILTAIDEEELED